MQSMIFLLRSKLRFDNFPYLTILANIFLGYALGKIVMTPGSEVGESIAIKVFLVIGTCLFANYLFCLRRAARGINRNVRGKLRPFLKEALLCAVLNGFVFIFSVTLFFLKSRAL